VACSDCQRRAALIAALAPAISQKSLNRQSLLGLLALPDEQLLHSARVKDPGELLRRLRISPPNERLPTALCAHGPDYPQTLAQLDCAPAVLHGTCTTERLRELLAAPVIAIVGDRVSTDYARQMTFALTHELASAGVTVIGNCTGLDAVALHATLHANGHCIGVMPTGAEHPYPMHDVHMHRRILAQGAAISEFPPGFSRYQGWCHIASQRIIAGLASLVVVVEAGERSLALFTARLAGELGRDLATVPGRVTDPGGFGTFALLRDGVPPVSCARDVLDLLPMVHTTKHRAQRLAA
jgi:DNA processing protein